MDEAAIIQFIRDNLAGVDVVIASQENNAPEVSWGDTFVFYDPEKRPDTHRFPFATMVTKDYPGFDEASNLSPDGVFRLNVGIGRESFESLFNGNETHDFAALDQIVPHPVYAKMHWVSVLNPSVQTFEKVKPLLAEAHARAASSY